MATKRCLGYTSNGEAGVAYSQPSHELENTEANFSPGKRQCRRCYDAYANDWRAMRSFAPQVRRAERHGLPVVSVDEHGFCTCGHPFTSHQTGEGPWTGFCYGTLGQLGGEYVRPGDDPNEPCECEAPTVSD